MVRQLFHSVSRLCKRHVRHWRNSLKSCGKKTKKTLLPVPVRGGNWPLQLLSYLRIPPLDPWKEKKSKQTEGRCEVISGNSSLIVLFWPPTPHAIQQQRRCAEKKTRAQVRAHATEVEDEVLRINAQRRRGQRESSFCFAAGSAGERLWANKLLSVSRKKKRKTKKSSRAHKRPARIGPFVWQRVCFECLYENSLKRKKKEEGQSFQMLILRRRLLV